MTRHKNYITNGTPRVNIVDRNDVNAATFAGGDNYRFGQGSGHAALPTLSAASVTITNQDTASVTFEIPETDRRPGNNWKVVAHTDLGYLNDVELDHTTTSKGLGFRLHSSPNVAVPQTVQSPLVTIWRTVNIELDTMVVPDVREPFGLVNGTLDRILPFALRLSAGNFGPDANNTWRDGFDGSLVNTVGNIDPGNILDLTGANPSTREVFGFNNASRSLFLYGENEYRTDGYNQNGNVDANNMPIVDEQAESMPLVDAGPGLNRNIAIQTDDPQWRGVGANALNPPDDNALIPGLNIYYLPAFIRFVKIVDGANPGQNTNASVTPFQRNSQGMIGSVDVPGDPMYITAMVSWAYEHAFLKFQRVALGQLNCQAAMYDGDLDPENEGVAAENAGGGTRGVTDVFPEVIAGGNNQVVRYGDQSVIYCEIIRDQHPDAAVPSIVRVVAHEIAHQLGVEHRNWAGVLNPEQTLEQQQWFVRDEDGIMGWERLDPPNNQCPNVWTRIRDAHAMPDAFSLRDVLWLRQFGNDVAGVVQPPQNN